MKKLFASSLIVMAITSSAVFAQQKTTAGSAEARTGESRSPAPAQAISDKSSKGSASSAGSSGHPSTTGSSSTSSGSPNVKLPSTQNATKTGQQSSTPPQAVNGNARKP